MRRGPVAYSEAWRRSITLGVDGSTQDHSAADHEAAAFYALSLLASEPDNDTTFANRKKAGAILEKLFETNRIIPASRTI